MNWRINGNRVSTTLGLLAITLLSGGIVASPVFEGLRGLSLDALTALRWLAFGAMHRPHDSPTVVIALDQMSYRTSPFKGTPTVTWTREIGRVIAGVLDGGAAVVGFDIVFPTSIEDSEISFDNETIGSRLRGFDRDFLRALAIGARAGKLVLGEVQQGDNFVGPTPGQRAAVGRQRNIRSLNVYSEFDGVVRHAPLMFAAGDKAVPSMSLELASRALGAAPQVDAGGTVNLNGFRIPTRTPNAMTLNFDGGSDDVPTYSFGDLHACLEMGDTEFFRRNFEGKVVIFGTTLSFEDAKMATNRFALTPLAPTGPHCVLPVETETRIVRNSIDGVYVHATAVNNLIRREAIAEFGGVSRWVVTTAAAGLAGIVAVALTPAWAALSFVLLALAWIACATEAFQFALALPLLEPLTSGLIALVATTGFRLFVSDKDTRILRRAFELYLPPAVIEKMLNSSKPPALGGEMRDVTMFFSDIVGFSALSETMDPPNLVSLMNAYLSAMTDIIEAHGGFVDKYIGDAIVAIFGAPVALSDHARQGVCAALDCMTELETLNRATSMSGAPSLAHRIGLNSGPALVGNIGSRRRFNYTVMGDAVNLASRLEGANKYFGTSILATQATMALTGDAFVWREIDVIRVKGRAEAVRVYEPIAQSRLQTSEQLARISSYREGLSRWRARDFAAAVEAFARCADTDTPSLLFLARAKRMTQHPPGETWLPIHVLDEK